MWENDFVKQNFDILCSGSKEKWKNIDSPMHSRSLKKDDETCAFSIKGHGLILKQFSIVKDHQETSVHWELIGVKNTGKIQRIGSFHTPDIAQKQGLLDHVATLFQPENQRRIQQYMLALQGIAYLKNPSFSFAHLQLDQLLIDFNGGEFGNIPLQQEEFHDVASVLETTAHPCLLGLMSNCPILPIDPPITAHQKIQVVEQAHLLFPKTIRKIKNRFNAS